MNYKTCWNLTQGYDECDEIKHLRAAIAAKDAEIERLREALLELQRCGQKQGFNSSYESTMNRVKKALAATPE